MNGEFLACVVHHLCVVQVTCGENSVVDNSRGETTRGLLAYFAKLSQEAKNCLISELLYQAYTMTFPSFYEIRLNLKTNVNVPESASGLREY